MHYSWLQENSEVLSVLFFILAGICEIIWKRARKNLFDYIKEKYPEIWKSLGYPRITGTGRWYLSMGPLEKDKIDPFIKQEYKNLNDGKLSRLILKMKISRFSEGLSILASIILLIITLIK